MSEQTYTIKPLAKRRAIYLKPIRCGTCGQLVMTWAHLESCRERQRLLPALAPTPKGAEE